MATLHDFTVGSPTGPVDLADHHGSVVLVVPIGRESGPTPQLAGLQKLADMLGSKGLVVLGVFDPPVPGSAGPTAEALGVTFPVLGPADEPGAAALLAWLSEQAPGVFGTTAAPGYTKFLVGRDGAVVRRFAATDDAAELIAAVQLALAAPVPPPPAPKAVPEAPAAEPTAAASPAVPEVHAGPPDTPAEPAPSDPSAALAQPDPEAPTASGQVAEAPAAKRDADASAGSESAEAEPAPPESVASEPAKSALVAPEPGADAAAPLDELPREESLADIAQDLYEVEAEVRMVEELGREQRQAAIEAELAAALGEQQAVSQSEQPGSHVTSDPSIPDGESTPIAPDERPTPRDRQP